MRLQAILKAAIATSAVLLLAACGTTSDRQNQPPPPPPADNVSAQGKLSLDRNFYFVFDGSGSMNDHPAIRDVGAKDVPKIDGAKWAVREFLKKVPDDVNLGLYVFDANQAAEVLPLGSNNRDQFLAKLDAVQAGGSTPLGAAIKKGADALYTQYRKQLGYGDYRLIVITDGEATDDLDFGVIEAERHKMPIYTIGFDMGTQHTLRAHSVGYRSAQNATEVEKGLEEAGAELDVYDATVFQDANAAAAKR
jgi:Mg-chelatase subunit ChlD